MKQTEYKLTVILDKESTEKLEKVAKINDRSVSAQLRVWIKEAKSY